MSEVRTKVDASELATITLGALAAGAARQSTYLANNGAGQSRGAAKITVQITSGAVAPLAGTAYEVWLLRAVGTIRDDNTGTTDAAYPVPPTLPRNATLLGTLSVTNTANQIFIGTFDTAPAGPLGPSFGIAIANRTDQAMNAAGHSVTIERYLPEIV